MKKKGIVLFGYDKPNRYSWGILMGFIGSDEKLANNYDFCPLPFQIYHSKIHSDYFNQINFQNYDFVVLAYSLLSIQMKSFQSEINDTHDFFHKFHKNIINIVGGAHVSAKPTEFIKYGIDFAIVGEGEIAFSSLLHALLEDHIELANMKEISGVAKLQSQYIPASDPELVEVGKYPPYSESLRLFGPIEISRGCPFRCKFCQTGNNSIQMRHASRDNIIKWIKRASEIKYDKVWFLTPNAFAYGSKNGISPNIEKLHLLLSQIHDIKKIKGIYFGTFPSEVRPESVTDEVMEVVLPHIANKKILIGAQSASNRLLKSILRGHTIEDIRKAIEILNKYNFLTEIDFIFGLPGENEQDIIENIHFFQEILENKIKNVKIHTHTFMPLPGTPFEDEKIGLVDSKIEKIIGKLAKAGKAYGEYQAQAGIVRNRYSN